VKVYVVSLAAGVLVGLIYALMQVRSPAPPAIALVGLLGMLIGEQAGPIIQKMVMREPITVSWVRTMCVARITGVDAKPAPGAQAGEGEDGRAPGKE
jgi:XapX domain-containing protein